MPRLPPGLGHCQVAHPAICFVVKAQGGCHDLLVADQQKPQIGDEMIGTHHVAAPFLEGLRRASRPVECDLDQAMQCLVILPGMDSSQPAAIRPNRIGRRRGLVDLHTEVVSGWLKAGGDQRSEVRLVDMGSKCPDNRRRVCCSGQHRARPLFAQIEQPGLQANHPARPVWRNNRSGNRRSRLTPCHSPPENRRLPRSARRHAGGRLPASRR